MVSVSVVQKLINMSHVSQEKNVHLWLMPVLQRGSSIKVGDIDFISSWFFLQASPRLVEAAIPEEVQDLAAFFPRAPAKGSS